MPNRLDAIQRANAAYIEDLYARFQADPESVPQDWAIFFAGFDLAGERGGGTATPGGEPTGGAFGLMNAYREFGHLIARLDPLGDNADTDRKSVV